MKKTIAGAALGLTLLCAACSSSGSSGGSGHATTGHAAQVPGQHASTSATQAGADSNSWCGEVAAASGSFLKGHPGDEPTLTPQDEQTAQKLIADAPASIRSDLQTLSEYEIALSQGKTDDPSSAHYFQSATHVATWMQSNCPELWKSLNPGGVNVGSAQPTS